MINLILRMSALFTIAATLIVNSPTTLNNSPKTKATTVVVQGQPVPSNRMVVSIVAKADDRAERLAKYFAANGSPFAPYAADFVKIADKYDLDWTFLPAIAKLESQLGLRVPAFSYNPYGWNNGKYRFKSWVDATEVVADGIRGRYAVSGVVTAHRIGKMYAASPTWAARVTTYQNQINRW